ncbi:MAG: cell division/cell wall cluster transcriptional repressor MraZ [Rickettsia sp.]|nr:cell division/cell wall cluster transcriptional repressor MraZ [Rickettsia sp.]
MSGKLFLSKFINKIDKKFRVSIPSAYRNILSVNNAINLIIYPSIKNKCIECCSQEYLERLFNAIKKIDPYTEERDAFETIILGSAYELTLDNEGRIIIPNNFVENFNLKEHVSFIGKGEIFEIWNPQNLEKHIENSQKLAKENLLRIKN